ncbi:MFS transporter, partial [Pseudomonas aeruginosa]
ALVVIGLTGVSMNPALVTRGARVGHNNMLVNSVHTACIMLGVMAGSWIGGLGIAGGFGLQGALWVGAALGVLALLTLLPELRFARAPVGGALGR